MPNIENIQRAVATLSSDELVQFRRWFTDFDTEAWYGGPVDVEADDLSEPVDGSADSDSAPPPEQP